MKTRITRIVVNTLLILPAAFFLFTGFQWLVSPADAAEAIG